MTTGCGPCGLRTEWSDAMVNGRIIDLCISSGSIEKRTTGEIPEREGISLLLLLLIVNVFLESPSGSLRQIHRSAGVVKIHQHT